jgi:Cu2+-exporting ATPase
MRIQVMMLTGDAEAVAGWVAQEVALDDYFAEVLPDEKERSWEGAQRFGG